LADHLPSTRIGTVLRARSGFYTVLADDGTVVECHLRGRVRRDRQTSDLAVIGDRVWFEDVPDGTGTIHSVEPRRSRFSRRQPGPRGAWREDVIVANPDLVAAVFACDRPPPNPRLIDRFLVVGEHNELAVAIIANKTDLVTPDAVDRTFGPYERLGYMVVRTAARSGVGVDEMAALLEDRLSVVIGPSGVGKSTLLNAIQPGLRLATAKVSEALSKGRHTTTVAELHRLDRGGYVADTPGIRELGLWQIPPEDLAWCFVEFRPFLGRCAFNDCSHIHEPRCAVRSALEGGEISEARYDSYRRLLTGMASID
jgi:ribosome biogenesis GTPase